MNAPYIRITWRKKKCWVYALCFFLTPISSFGQYFALQISEGKTIADPSVLTNNAAFLRYDSIAKELGLDELQTKEVKQFLRETNGVPSVLSTPLEKLRRTPEEKAERLAQYTSVLAERERKICEILDPIQRDRLRQLVYQIEISRAGPAESLIDGFLGRDSGIEDYDKPALRIIFEALTREVNVAVNRVLSNGEKEILAKLTTEQRELYPKLVGKVFPFREDGMERLTRIAREQSFGKFANPEHFQNVALLLKNASVANEVDLTEEESIVISRSMVGRIAPKASKELTTQVDPKKLARLRQISYRLEIMRIGLGSAICQGFLGKALMFSSSQRTELAEELLATDAKLREEINKIEVAARERFLRELTPAQKETASKLVGRPFAFQE